jgi:hypothetical protein
MRKISFYFTSSQGSNSTRRRLGRIGPCGQRQSIDVGGAKVGALVQGNNRNKNFDGKSSYGDTLYVAAVVDDMEREKFKGF